MTELDISQIKKKSFKGIIALIQRSFILQFISAVSTIILAYYFDSSVFGVFSIVSAIIGFLGYFSDIGLAASLIQKKESLTEEDLATTFTIQQIMVTVLIIIGFLCTPFIQQWYSLDQSGMLLYYAVLVSFQLSSLKTIPSILMERRLDFQKLVIPQILETLVFNAVLIIFAISGLGVISYAWAVLLRGIVGLICIYMIQPWKIHFYISKSVASRLFKFGIPFQSNSLLALIKDDLLFLVLGRLLTLDQLGFIFLGKRLAELPLRNIMDNVMRVTFPAFSRMQHDSKILAGALEKSIFGISLIVFPLYTGMIFFIQPFIELVPKYQKWQPALLSFYFLCVTSIAASISTPLTNALNAIGKIKVTLGLMIMWIILTWMLVLFFIHMIGYHGFALALMLISFTFIVVAAITKKFIHIRFYGQIWIQAVGAAAMACCYAVLLPLISHTIIGLFTVGILGVFVYSGIVWFGKKESILSLVHAFIRK